jgi:hypothetical protein
MSHAHQGGQAPDQASSGRQTGAAAHTQTNHSQGTHTAASHPTSHTRHGDNQAGNEPRQTNPPTLTDAPSRPTHLASGRPPPSVILRPAT